MIYGGNKLLSNFSFDGWLTIPTGIIRTMETMIDNLLKSASVPYAMFPALNQA